MSGFSPYRIGSVPHRLRSRRPSAIAMTTRISSGRGASATETVIASNCGNDQESSLCPSGTSSEAPEAATLTFDPITAFPPPIAARIGFPSIGWTQAPPCSISQATQTIAPLPYETAGPSRALPTPASGALPTSHRLRTAVSDPRQIDRRTGFGSRPCPRPCCGPVCLDSKLQENRFAGGDELANLDHDFLPLKPRRPK